MALGSVQPEWMRSRGGVSDTIRLAGNRVPGLPWPDADPVREDTRVLPGEIEQV